MRPLTVFSLLLVLSCCLTAQSAPAIIACVFPRNGPIQPGQIDPHAITRINYAFSNIENNRMVAGSPSDPANLALLTALRQQNPALTVLISVGGWTGSGDFSQMAATKENRAVFIQSVMDFVNLYHLDGLDIDWEYPGMPGSGHAFLAQDKQNFTSLLRELRARFDKEQAQGGRRLYLSVAVGASEEFLTHTEMAKVARYVDTVNLMTYDYYEPGSQRITGHHAPLYPNPADPEHLSSDASVQAFEKAGVPADKLTLGLPFYGHVWSNVPDNHHGLYQPGKAAPTPYVQYANITGLLHSGYVRYWDPVARVPYLYNAETKSFVSYEDPQSAAEKCRYVRAHHLAGVMFWEYFGDNGELLHTIDTTLRAK